MRYTTALTGISFYAYHGLYAEERILGQYFTVDLSVVLELDAPIAALEDAVNYEVLFQVAKEEMAIQQELIETVAQRIVARLQAYFGSTASIEVTICKPNPAGVFKSGVARVTFSV